MTLKYRRILYLSFIAVFLIVTPIVTFYAAGYRYNLKRHRIEKTGILYIDSRPKQAMILINGKYENETPARFPNLIPDVYQVEVKKEGYHPWQKNLEVKSNLTTFAKDIVLFKDNLPISLVLGNINFFSLSPSQDKIVYSIIKDKTEQLRLLNLNNKSDFLISEFNYQKKSGLSLVDWSENQNKLLLKSTEKDFNNFLIDDIDTLKIKKISDISKINFEKITWDETNESYLYGLNEDNLYQIDLANSLAKPIITEKIKDFQAKGAVIYYISQTDNGSFLNKAYVIKPTQPVDKIEKIRLTLNNEFSLLPSPADYLVLSDQKNGDLFLINTQAFTDGDINKHITLQDQAKKIFWSKDEKNLLALTDFEIWTFDLVTQQKSLITRYGSIINDAKWYPTNKYVIYQVENKISSIEASLLEPRNDIKIAELPEIKDFFIDDSGKNLYFKTSAANLWGIYSLQLQ
ncbi:MAG: PEGA domain-containing protein [Candidatus Buchananbacteria bacterium]